MSNLFKACLRKAKISIFNKFIESNSTSTTKFWKKVSVSLADFVLYKPNISICDQSIWKFLLLNSCQHAFSTNINLYGLQQ